MHTEASRPVLRQAASIPHRLGSPAMQGPLALMGTPFPYARNAEIYGEGDEAEYLYQVISGTVRTYKMLEDGRRQIGAFYLPGDIFGYAPRDTRMLLHRAMERIADEGRGVILYLRRAGRGLDVFDVPEGGSPKAPSTGFASPRASIFRDFGIGAQILRDIGVRKIRWLTNNPLRLVSLPGYGLEIVEWVPLSDTAGTRAGDPAQSKVVPLR